MVLGHKQLLTFFITHKNQDLKKAEKAKKKHGLHSGGLVCIVEARSA